MAGDLRSAFGVFASAAELLGRCLSGNASTGSANELRKGLQFMFPDGLTTSTTSYGINNLAHLRHFAAHGQAAATVHDIDYQVLERCPGPFGDAVERYWELLISDEGTCGRLAQAKITPLQPSRLKSVWRQFGDAAALVSFSMRTRLSGLSQRPEIAQANPRGILMFPTFAVPHGARTRLKVKVYVLGRA